MMKRFHEARSLYSSRGCVADVLAPQALLDGPARDGGLYMPDLIPRFEPEEWLSLSYPEIAFLCLKALLPGFKPETLNQAAHSAYSKGFDHRDIAPICSTSTAHILELYHGPTAAFKDFALRALAPLMSAAMDSLFPERPIQILVATSGDTGSAALAAFRDQEGIQTTVFFPEEGVSPIQKAQMLLLTGPNAVAVGVRGDFDDCQNGVKLAFKESVSLNQSSDAPLLSSANSINIGRLVPQMAYYFHAYASLVRSGAIQYPDSLNFVVPTGNFGDIFAAYMAKMAGLPVGRLIVASNSNRVLTDFFTSGIYDRRRKLEKTFSPSMDILVSSNLERLLSLFCPADETTRLMASLNTEGHYQVREETLKALREHFDAFYADDEACLSMMKRIFEEDHVLIDPHTACAFCALEQARKNGLKDGASVVLSTASPYKFPSAVIQALGLPIEEDSPQVSEQIEALTGVPQPEALRGILSHSLNEHPIINPEELVPFALRKAGLA